MQIYKGEAPDTTKLHVDRTRNTTDYHNREQAEATARRLSESWGYAKVLVGQSVLAEFQHGEQIV